LEEERASEQRLQVGPDAYRARVGEDEAARPRRDHGGEVGYQLAEQRTRLGFTRAGLA
jgi:hypothetical protein